MTSLEFCKEALREMKARPVNAVAVYQREGNEPVVGNTPIAELLNAGYPAWIPYFDPHRGKGRAR